MFTTKKRNTKQIRKKVLDDEEESNNAQPDQMKDVAPKKVEVKKVAKASVLSFADDVIIFGSNLIKMKEPEDNSSEFRITANTANIDVKIKKKSTRSVDADQPQNSGVSAIRNTSDYYTPENLEAMKKLSMNYNPPKKAKSQKQGNLHISTSNFQDEHIPESEYPLDDEVILNDEQADALEDEEDEEIKRWEMEQIKKGNICW
jgi:hypothetical protein